MDAIAPEPAWVAEVLDFWFGAALGREAAPAEVAALAEGLGF